MLVGVSLIGMIADGLRFKVVASPKVGLSGQTLTMKVTVPRAKENRQIAFAVECSSGFYQSWQEQIFGERGPGVFDWRREKMAPGWCELSAMVAYLDPTAKQGVGYRSAHDTACFAGMDVQC